MFSDYRIVDLSHELHEKVPTWTGDCSFRSSIDLDYEEEGCRVMSYQLAAGVGTHLDAPSHFVEKGLDVSQISLENLVVPLCVLRVFIGDQSDYLITKADVEHFEEQYGPIPEKSLVVADTGWSQRWKDPERYRNVDASRQMHFPGFHIEAVKRLLGRQISGIGVDTLSPDGGNTLFPVHHLLLSQGKYIIENLAHLDLVPPSGAWMIALPMKVRAGAEACCRCMALIPSQ